MSSHSPEDSPNDALEAPSTLRAPDSRQDGEQDCPVVGIGASAGGVSALRRFFQHLPDEVGMAFVVVLHLSPDHESNLTEILQHDTEMPVQTATDDQSLEADHVYVIPPQHEMWIEGTKLRLSTRTGDHRPDTIDALLSSLAEEYESQAIGIVLSGTGADGTLGLRSIKAHRGIAMVQEPSDAEHPEMPRNALNAGVIDLVCPADELAERLVAYHQNARTIQLPESEDALPSEEQTTLQKIFAELQARTGHDFSHYKRSTVLRRLERRLQVTDTETLDAYLQVLRDRPGEARALYKELLISVTRFFRTPKAFEALAETVVPSLFADKDPDDEVRVWVAGCATGEEAYSVAMLLREYAHTLEVPPELQVFATDVDTEGLDAARRGVYPITIEADVTEDRLDRFFLREDDQYRVTPSLRNTVVFAEHNLIEDPPFSDLDLVCCRNVLIYFDQSLQEYVFRLFHYALNADGFLFLGPSEAVGPAQSLFTVVDETRSILKVKPPPADDDRPMPLFPPSDTVPTQPSQPTTTAVPTQDVPDLHQRLLMKQTASLVVDENHEIVHLTERAGQFLEHEAGEPTHNLLEKVPPVLRLELRGALYQAFQKAETTERTIFLPLGPEGTPGPVRVKVQPVDDPEVDRFLAQVRFESVEEPSSDDAEVEDVPARESGKPTGRERDLEDELQDVKEQLQIKTEEYETVTEEMETANEELMSMNEELQAKNEELQTSKEQLQSVNEELTTTNRQLNAKVDALDQANSDLQNLMEATEVATLFLDRGLEIQRYTPPITDIFRLRDSDIGRPITDFTPKIEYEGLIEDARRVLKEQVSLEHEVQNNDGTWYLMRLRPYRTVADDVEGVVMTFVDITAQKRVAQQLREERDLISALIDTAGALIIVLDEEGSIVRFNTACERLTGYDAPEAEGEDMRDLLVVSEDREAVTVHLEALSEGDTDRADLEMKWTADDEQFLIRGSITALSRPDGTVRHFIVTGTDITERRKLEREIVEISERERMRIGEDLHDVISSGLTNVTMRLDTLAFKLEEEGAVVDVEDLEAISSKVKEAANQVRSISHALVPKALRQDYLASALADMAEKEEEFSDITCEFLGDADETRPDDETDAMNLYRIAHEAVANAREHADPNRITIELTEEDSDLVLSIRDDGVGWNGDGPDEEGLGLYLMRHRANLIGATLNLTSADGETGVECRLPL